VNHEWYSYYLLFICIMLNLFWVVQYIVSLFLQITVVEEGDLIAKRTRSQLPLQDVSIESIEGIYC